MLAAGIQTPRMLAKRVGITEQMARRWLKQSKFTGSAQRLMVLGEALNVRAHWLFSGVGPPHRLFANAYTEDELLRVFRMLPTTEQRKVIDMVTVMTAYLRA